MRGTYLRRTPPSSDALRHSGGERRRWTSATVTLYFEVELSSDRRPGTVQKTSEGAMPPVDEEEIDTTSLPPPPSDLRTKTATTVNTCMHDELSIKYEQITLIIW